MPQHVLRGLHPVCPRGTCATAPFASARPTRIASFDSWIAVIRPLLCLSTSYADCIPHASATPAGAPTLPQHVLRGLHRGSGISALQMLIFASARPTRIASLRREPRRFTPCSFASARPTRIASTAATAMEKHVNFASARPTRIASAKTHKVRLAFMTDGAVSR